MSINEVVGYGVAGALVVYLVYRSGLVYRIQSCRQRQQGNVDKPSDERKNVFGLFEFGKGLAGLYIALDCLGTIFLVVNGVNTSNENMVIYGIVAGAAAILFCILVLAVFSIREQVCGMRGSQLEMREA